MSVSLITFRLEISDTSVEPLSFRYCVLDSLKCSNEKDLDTVNAKSVPGSALEKQIRCLGRRQYKQYTLETFTFMDQICSDVNSEVELPSSHRGSDYPEELPPASPTGSGHNTNAIMYKNSPPTFGVQEDSKRSHSGSRFKASGPILPAAIHFLCGNPTLELTEGVLHLYKDTKRTSLHGDVARSELICMVAVPAALTLHDLLQFTDQVYPGVEYIKVIKDQSPNQYMVLIKFRTQKGADEFYNNYNGKPFNSIEPYLCHLVYVARVEFLKASDNASLPIPGLIELPQCPVCLERMDESVEGILTILCNHSFHGYCLSKWGDATCPVCRCCQTPEPASEDSHCLTCGSPDSLWICLICGHVGCGRYVAGHANEHFRETAHTYAMQLSDRRVWDYVGDNYVHRLIQNKEDGKLVEYEDENGGGRRRGDGVAHEDEKVESLMLEYTYLLTSQLESQRRYFEARAARAEKESLEREQAAEAQAALVAADLEAVKVELEAANRERALLRCKVARTEAALARLGSELSDERQMGACLQENERHWQDRARDLERRIDEVSTTHEREMSELRDQLRDVMFSLDAPQRFAASSNLSAEELHGSRVEVAAQAADSPVLRRPVRKKR